MTRKAKIEVKLQSEYAPVHLDVSDESHGHNVPEGMESHFRVVIVSASFDDLPKVRRHQSVYAALAEEFKSGLHALALHLYTPDEWASRESAPESPACMGGSKG